MTRRTIMTLAALISAGGLALGSGAAHAQANFLTDLGAVAPGLAINNNGQVVLQNYFYSSGTLTAFPADFTGAGINASGQVVGVVGGHCSAVNSSCGAIGVWTSGAVTTYPVFMEDPQEDVGNQGWSINASGQIVGDFVYNNTSEEEGALLLNNGVFSQLNFPAGGVCAYPLSTSYEPFIGLATAINDAGQVAGMLPQGPVGEQCWEAFLLSQGIYTDIGAGQALALNATGQVVGYLFFGPIPSGGPFPPSHAFLYDSASATPTAQDLGTLPGGNTSNAYAINSQGLIVGASCPSGSSCGSNYASAIGSGATAFFYDGLMIDLNTFILPSDPLQPYVTLTDARGINDSGLIIVNGVDSRTKAAHAYLLQAPTIQVAPGPLSFPSEPIGSTSAPQTLTFTNAGTTALALGTAATAGAYTIQSNNCGSSLAAATACMISVAYAPTASASPAGTLTLPAGGVPIAVPLSTALTVSITSSSSTTTTGTAVTLNWIATPGSSCTATGGSSSDGWTGTLSPSGSKAVTEATAASYTYGITCTAGVQTQSAQASVTVSWAAVTVTLTASATTLYTGQPTTLTWSSKNATACASSGGGSNDGWPNGSRPTSGSAMITEPNPVISGGSETLTFTLTCTSSVSNLSGAKSVNVVQLDQPPPSGGGGGGAFDPLALLFLFGVLAAPRMRRPVQRFLLPKKLPILDQPMSLGFAEPARQFKWSRVRTSLRRGQCPLHHL